MVLQEIDYGLRGETVLGEPLDEAQLRVLVLDIYDLLLEVAILDVVLGAEVANVVLAQLDQGYEPLQVASRTGHETGELQGEGFVQHR